MATKVQKHFGDTIINEVLMM